MHGKRFEDITIKDIEYLIENEIIEDKELDYKRDLPSKSHDGQKEYLQDISAFANASGGYMIFGIEEERNGNKNTGKPKNIVGLRGVINEDETKLILENMVRDNIEPHIAGIRYKMIKTRDGSDCVFVVKIPESWGAPHMLKNRGAFYSRNSAGKNSLDVYEIRNAFVLSEAVTERIRNFRYERLGKIVAEETPVSLYPYPKVVLHILPLESFRKSVIYDLSTIYEKGEEQLRTLSNGYAGKRYNFDGLVFFSGAVQSLELGKHVYDYVQIFRNGCIEAVSTLLAKPMEEGKKYIKDFGDKLFEPMKKYLNIQKDLGIAAPVYVLLSILGIKGYYLKPQQLIGENPFEMIDKNDLLFSEKFVDDLDQEASEILKETLQIMRQL